MNTTPALGSGQEFCIAVLSDKAEAPDINSYLDPNVTPPDKEGGGSYHPGQSLSG